MDIAKEMEESSPLAQPLTLAQRGAWIGGLQNPVEIVRVLSEV